MSSQERAARKTRAAQLRLAGLSRSQIARALGLKSGGGALDRWLRGTPAPEWTKRPRAKDHVRWRAVELRREGRSYREIEAVLGVSRSSLSLWLKDIPLTEEHRAALADRKRGAVVRRAAAIRAASRARDRRLVQEAVTQIGQVSDGELFIAGVVAYWAEGAKTKPWGPREGVEFINSDPGMVVLFLRWLDLLGIPRTQLTYRVSIHEAADVDGALRFWSKIVKVPPGDFRRTSLKRHNPRTARKNVGDGSHGCLTVSVKRSTDLNSRIRGWFEGIVEPSEELISAGAPNGEV
ncbi:MAG TPA: helix-turn-helix domain-containing protein [Actinomycetota bacterium]|nr:helix-turn-helix domain-containing protein [Actinomycetota bacterium]